MLVVLLGAIAVAVVFARPRADRRAPPHVASAEDLLRLAAADGLHCLPGSPLPNHASGHFVTDRPRDRAELDQLCKAHCGQGPQWDGILWVCDLSGLGSLPGFETWNIGGNCRTLGRVCVAGDQRLIDRIEQLCRLPKRSRGQ